MQHLTPLEPGVVFWGERDNLAEIRSLDVRCGQLITPGGMQVVRWVGEVLLRGPAKLVARGEFFG